MRADAAAAALLALALHAFVQTKTTAIAVLAKTLAPPVSADAAATTFLAVALAPTVDADAAPPELLALAFHTTMGAYSGTATIFAPASLSTVLANAATAAVFTPRTHFQVHTNSAAVVFFALAFLPFVIAPLTATALLAVAPRFSVQTLAGRWRVCFAQNYIESFGFGSARRLALSVGMAFHLQQSFNLADDASNLMPSNNWNDVMFRCVVAKKLPQA